MIAAATGMPSSSHFCISTCQCLTQHWRPRSDATSPSQTTFHISLHYSKIIFTASFIRVMFVPLYPLWIPGGKDCCHIHLIDECQDPWFEVSIQVQVQVDAVLRSKPLEEGRKHLFLLRFLNLFPFSMFEFKAILYSLFLKRQTGFHYK